MKPAHKVAAISAVALGDSAQLQIEIDEFGNGDLFVLTRYQLRDLIEELIELAKRVRL